MGGEPAAGGGPVYTAAMIGRLELCRLPGTKRAGEVARTVEALYREGRRIVVWLADEGRRGIMDEYLWTFRQLAFVPHAVWEGETGEAEEPVVLVGRPVNPNGATVLVVGDDLPPADWAATFEAVYDFIPPGEEGERREAWWREQREADGA